MFEVSSGGHRGRDIPQCTCMDSIFTLLLWGNTFHWQCYVFSECMGSAHSNNYTGRYIEDIAHMQTEKLALKRKLSSMLTQLPVNGLCPAVHARGVLLIQTLSYS